MRPASAVLGDLWILIELTELGTRAAPRGRERWALDCARRAVAATIEALWPETPVVKQTLTQAQRWLDKLPEPDLLADADAGLGRVLVSVQQRASAATRHSKMLEIERAHRAVEAVRRALACIAGASEHEQVATLARAAFVDGEIEAAAQARRLLVFTKLLPTGADLLVRLDYAESCGRMPSDPAERAWIEDQRVALMREEEQVRMAVLLRQLELVFQPELDRIR